MGLSWRELSDFSDLHSFYNHFLFISPNKPFFCFRIGQTEKPETKSRTECEMTWTPFRANPYAPFLSVYLYLQLTLQKSLLPVE